MAALVGKEWLRVIHGADYPMSDVRQAHEALAGRQTTGKLVLDPRE